MYTKPTRSSLLVIWRKCAQKFARDYIREAEFVSSNVPLMRVYVCDMCDQ